MRARIAPAAAVVAALLAALLLGITSAAASSAAVAVKASKSSLHPAGGKVTLTATVKDKATECEWTSSPPVKNFDTTVKCASTLKRTAELPANHSDHAKQYTFTLTAKTGTKKATGHAAVTVRGKSTTTTTTTSTTTTSSTTTTTTLCIGPVCV